MTGINLKLIMKKLFLVIFYKLLTKTEINYILHSSNKEKRKERR